MNKNNNNNNNNNKQVTRANEGMASSEEEHMNIYMPLWKKRKWESSKPLSPIDTSRERAWERKRKMWERMMARRGKNKRQDCFDDITDEDLRELRGCIELGFGFNEEDAQDLCATLPALELYFAVNRQVSASPRSNVNDSPAAIASPTTVDPDAWKICSPGENPEQVKTRLRHWAQAVACSVMQSQ